MASGEERGLRHPGFLSWVGPVLGVRRDRCRSREVSPPGQDQTLTPARAGKMPVSPGRAAQHPPGRGWREAGPYRGKESGRAGVVSHFTSLGLSGEGSGEI